MDKTEEYNALVAGIDNSVAGSDEYGNLAWHVDCSAMANSGEWSDDIDYDYNMGMQHAIDTAKNILDSWGDFYPQLVIENNS